MNYLILFFSLLFFIPVLSAQSDCAAKIMQGRSQLAADAPHTALQTVDAVLAGCSGDALAHQLKGDALSALFRYEEAMLSFAQSDELLGKAGGRDSLRVEILYNLAGCCMRTSQYAKGLAALETAMILQKNRSGEYSGAYLRLLNRYINLGINAPDVDPTAMVAYAEKCLLNTPNLDDKTKSDFYLGHGIIYTQRGLALTNDSAQQKIYYQKADAAFQTALQVNTSDTIMIRRIRGGVWYTIGGGYQLRSQYALAEQAFRTSMDYLKGIKASRETYIWSFASLVRCQCPQGKYKECLELGQDFLQTVQYDPKDFARCLFLSQTVRVNEHLLQAQYALGVEDKSKERCQQAVALCREVLHLLDYSISKIDRNQLKYRFVDIASNIYDVVAKILYNDHSASSLELLFEVSERNKSYLLNNAGVERSAMQFAGVPASLVADEENLRRQIHQKEKNLAQAYQTSPDHDETKQLIYRDLADLYHQYDALKAKMKAQYPDFFNYLLNKNVATIQEVQADLTREQTLLEYYPANEYLYIFVLNRGDYKVHRIAYTAPIQDAVKAFHQHIYKPYTDPPKDDLYQQCADIYAQSGHQLYQILIEPYRSDLRKQIIIVPDGLLNYVPFEALLTATPTKNTRYGSHAYLLHDYIISYAYSATLLRENRQKKTDQGKKQFLGIAPSFQGGNTGNTNRQPLRPLLHNKTEVTEIQAVTGGDVLIGEKATKGRFTQLAHQYQIIHLATHAEAMDRIGDYSFLAFTSSQATDSLRLFSKEIYALSIQADMVVLSACQTGIGELKRGEGVISIARAFMYAGAKCVVTSLWSVDDHKTKELMIDFYGQLKSGTTKDYALRQAKLNYLARNTGEAAHPFYWAGFVALGDMKRF
jgi:CHAT domain-containing protein